MAIVKIQAPLVGIRGKYGGMIFSENGSSAYVKQWCYPTDPRSTLQTPRRNNLATIRFAWNSLTQGQIDDWNYLAAHPPEIDHNSLGETILLSGSAWHTRINLRRLQVGDAIDNTAPAIVSVNPPATFGLTVYQYEFTLRTDLVTYTQNDFDGFYAILHIAPAFSLAKQSISTGFLSIWSGTIADDVEQDITTPLANAFGWLTIGNRLFGRLYKQSTTGIRSLPRENFFDVLSEP